MIAVKPGQRDTLVRIESPAADTRFRGAGSGTWHLVGEEWIELREQLPSRGEQSTGVAATVTRRARVRMDWRGDIDATMRLVHGARVLQIVSAPVELGRRAGLEFMVEEHLPAGNPA